MSFLPTLQSYQERVNEALDDILPSDDPPEHHLATAIRYSIIGGGKRIRPAMVYAAGSAVGADESILDIPACSVELIHAYSLIHDDLPAMDDDDLRRGRPTCHRKFDEATAILAGDAIQALAYEILADEHFRPADDGARLRILKLITHASGASGMAGGQAMDLASVGRNLSLEQLEKMHQLKTGALIHASIIIGALCSPDTTEKQLNDLERYALCIGLSFQIQDDILDVTGSTETLGKAVGADERLAKPTYPSIIGLEGSQRLALEKHAEALSCLEDWDDKADPLRELSEYIVTRES